jgi:hypothetical protein
MSKNPNAMHNQPVLILGDSFSRHGFVDAARATFSVVYNTEETKYDIDKDVMDFARKNGIKIILLVAVERGAPSLANIKPTGK